MFVYIILHYLKIEAVGTVPLLAFMPHICSIGAKAYKSNTWQINIIWYHSTVLHYSNMVPLEELLS